MNFSNEKFHERQNIKVVAYPGKGPEQALGERAGRDEGREKRSSITPPF
jgi:hypothetical protein